MKKELIGDVICDTLEEAKTVAWELLQKPEVLEHVMISNWTRFKKGWRVSPSYTNDYKTNASS